MKAPDTHSPRRTNTKSPTRGCSCGAVPGARHHMPSTQSPHEVSVGSCWIGPHWSVLSWGGYQSIWTLHQRLLSSSVRAAALGCGHAVSS
ncbi:hypothetical protein HMPREF1297_01179 [Propionibacterium sp. KPL2000]|nr:hypothetical protein HMPREF1297_01179 [Propionibacterium sp. KPL2000]